MNNPPTLSTEVHLPAGYWHQCPHCGGKDIATWERYSDFHKDIVGGKNCQTCYAISRRWLGAGTGRSIWVHGPGIQFPSKVGEANQVLLAATT